LKITQRQYLDWIKRNKDCDLSCFVCQAWEYIRGRNKDDFEGLFALMYCLLKMSRKQNIFFRQLCAKAGVSVWDEYVSLSGAVIVKVSRGLDVLVMKKNELPADEFGPYFYRVLFNIKSICMKESISQFYDDKTIQEQNNDRGIAATPEKNEEAGLSEVQSIGELLEEQHLLRLAQELLAGLIEDWAARDLNVLCEYYEHLLGQKSRRLSMETSNNVYKLRERVRKKLIAYQEKKQYPDMVWRLFLSDLLPEICQKIPVMLTYKNKKGGDNNE